MILAIFFSSFDFGLPNARLPRRALTQLILTVSRPNRSPSGVRSVERRWNTPRIDAGEIHRPQIRPTRTLGRSEEHQHAPVGRPTRAFVAPAVGKEPLVAAV